MGRTAKFRQSAPEIRVRSRFAALPWGAGFRLYSIKVKCVQEKLMYRITRFVLLSVCAAGLLCAQDEPPAQAPAGGGGGRGGLGAGAATVPDPQPYDRVITKDAKTTKGLFTVHQIKERYYFEIPKSELGKDLLWNSRLPLSSHRATLSTSCPPP